MEFKKRQIQEIIDSNGDLIGANDIPQNGSDLESQAKNTTDYNQKIGTQPYRWDFLGRMGFGFPFYEGKEDKNNALTDKLVNVLSDLSIEIIRFYYKNPNKLKSDYRKFSQDNTNPKQDVVYTYTEKVIELIHTDLKETINEPFTIDEAIVEDKVISNKSEEEMSLKGLDNDVREKKLEKIAGLINKLDKSDQTKLINLLELKIR